MEGVAGGKFPPRQPARDRGVQFVSVIRRPLAVNAPAQSGGHLRVLRCDFFARCAHRVGRIGNPSDFGCGAVALGVRVTKRQGRADASQVCVPGPLAFAVPTQAGGR